MKVDDSYYTPDGEGFGGSEARKSRKNRWKSKQTSERASERGRKERKIQQTTNPYKRYRDDGARAGQGRAEQSSETMQCKTQAEASRAGDGEQQGQGQPGHTVTPPPNLDRDIQAQN
jgi:hypothetical protein